MEPGNEATLTLLLSVLYATGDVPCPLFENEKIIQQPADFLTLMSTYINAATSFIESKAGEGEVHVSFPGSIPSFE